jgi:hypothetical protein
MGVRALDPGEWIDLDPETLEEQLAVKRELLATRRDDVVVTLDDLAEEPSRELDDSVASWWASDGRPPPAEPPASEHPVVRAALRTQEDWCVLAPVTEGGPPVLVAACVCFPTRWILQEKLGQTMGEIHRPVAFYDAQLEDPVDRFIERLAPGRAVWRANWNLVDDPALFQGYQPDPARRLDLTPDDVADRVFLRVERQTLRRLERTGAVVFGIRVHQRPLRSLESRPEELDRLREAVDALPPASFAYKGVGAFWDPLRTWLTRSGPARP